MILLDCQTLGLCHLKYYSRSQITLVECGGLWSVTQVKVLLSLQREVLGGPDGSSWGASPPNLVTFTMEGGETTEPWKAGEPSAHGG